MGGYLRIGIADVLLWMKRRKLSGRSGSKRPKLDRVLVDVDATNDEGRSCWSGTSVTKSKTLVKGKSRGIWIRTQISKRLR